MVNSELHAVNTGFEQQTSSPNSPCAHYMSSLFLCAFAVLVSVGHDTELFVVNYFSSSFWKPVSPHSI